jgi:hypothetical protein
MYEKKLKNTFVKDSRIWRQRISESLYYFSKVMDLFTSAPTPFYRETKGLLHFDIALGSKEYSKLEHVYECLLHPVIYEANFRYLQACHPFTPRIRTYDTTLLTWSAHGSCLHF